MCGAEEVLFGEKDGMVGSGREVELGGEGGL